MEEQRIVGLRIFHQPMHCSKNVCFRGLAHRILLVIRQKDHIFSRVPKISIQVCRHILHIIDASSKLTFLTEVIDTNQKRFPFPGASGVLKIVSLRCARTETLGALGGRRWGVVVALDVRVVIHRRNACHQINIILSELSASEFFSQRTRSSSVHRSTGRRRSKAITSCRRRWTLHEIRYYYSRPTSKMDAHRVVSTRRSWRSLLISISWLR